GMVCDAVNALAARHGLRFAPDPSTSNRATIGGMVGNNASGARAIRYGTTADCIAGRRVVPGHGEVIETRPLDAAGREPARSRAPIGGMGGNNASGARPSRYGTTADCIAGLRVVLANGEVIETRPLDVEGEELARILAQDTLEAHIYRTVLAVTSEYAGDIA